MNNIRIEGTPAEVMARLRDLAKDGESLVREIQGTEYSVPGEDGNEVVFSSYVPTALLD